MPGDPKLQPYRRFVALVFALSLAVLAAIILRGIIRHLDRLPSIDGLERPAVVDVRALRACAEDLGRLEVKVRRTAARQLGVSPERLPSTSWQDVGHALELELLAVVARCHLDQSSADPVRRSLVTATQEITEMSRAYALLLERHRTEALSRASAAQQALAAALSALDTP